VSLYYDASNGLSLADWIQVNGKPGAVLTIAPGSYHLGSPAFINGYTLRGEDPDQPSRIVLGERGLVWMAQPPLPTDHLQRIVKTSGGRDALATHPGGGLAPASFDATETVLGSPWHRIRKVSIAIDLDCPSGDIKPGGLFDLGPIALWINDNPDWGRFVSPLLALGTSSADPSPRRVEAGISWKKSTGPKCSIRLDIDLNAGTGSVTINGDVLPIPGINPGDVFPACSNPRVTIGGMPTLPGSVARRGEWQTSGPPPDLRITRFEVDSGIWQARLNLDGWRGPRIWASNGAGAGIFPVTHDAKTFQWVGGESKIRNLNIVAPRESNRSGVRIGQAMTSNAGIYDCRFEQCGAAVRKLRGLVSYTHRFERITSEYCSWHLQGQGMTVWGRDWSARYPRFGVADVPDSNLSVDGIEVASPSDPQYYFRIGSASNGGMLSVRNGMLNDEDGSVVAGAIFRHDGPGWPLLTIDNITFNPDPRRPSLSLGKATGGKARIAWQPYGAAITDVGEGWTLSGASAPEKPEVKPSTEESQPLQPLPLPSVVNLRDSAIPPPRLLPLLIPGPPQSSRPPTGKIS
jgi:hypothetical protein